jgi:hypothetical protein
MQSSLLPIAILAAVTWSATFVAILIATQPRPASRAAQIRSNWAELPPAIVALLAAHDGKVPERAVTATFLDLVARGVLRRTVEPSGLARIEPAAGDHADLNPYEYQVFDHAFVRARIGGGAVPEDALQLESSEHATRWMDRFSEKVVDDAKARGLSEDRVSSRMSFRLWAGLLAVLVLLAVAWIGTLLAVIAFIVLAPILRLLERQRATEAGVALVPMYRALAAQQGAGAADPSRPIDRSHAYAAALGAGTPVRSPLAHRESRLAWSNRGGQWRQLRIADASGVFQGSDPKAALYAIPGALVFFAIWARLLYDFTAHPQRWSIPFALLAIGWLIYLSLNFFVWRFVYRGIYDLRARTVHVEGKVIYFVARESSGENTGKNYHVAIDDGRGGEAPMHEIDRVLFERLRYGDWLRLEVTPKLRCVRSTELVTAPAAAAQAGRPISAS